MTQIYKTGGIKHANALLTTAVSEKSFNIVLRESPNTKAKIQNILMANNSNVY
jgi:hypothetical protein